MSARLAVAGYFGCGNLGDDAILLGFVQGISGHLYNISVLCGQPEVLMRQYGLKGVQRMDPRAVAQAIKDADALVFPGGSIFQDVSSVRSVAYYSRLVSLAKKSKKKVVLLGQGVGPLTTFLGKRFAGSAFSASDAIAVRDQASATAIRGLGVSASPRVTGDLAFLLPEPSRIDEAFGVAGMTTIGISARPFRKARGTDLVAVFGEFCKLLFAGGYMPVLIEMDREADKPLILAISRTQGGKVPDIRDLETPMQAQQRIARMSAVVAMRLHAGILASTVGVPAMMVSYDPKVTAFANAMGWPTPQNIQGVTAARLYDAFQSFIKDRDRIAGSLPKKREQMAAAAAQNIDLLASVLGC